MRELILLRHAHAEPAAAGQDDLSRSLDATGRAEAQAARLRALMTELGVEELAQDRLERMFAYYNANWPTYYGTEETFTVE